MTTVRQSGWRWSGHGNHCQPLHKCDKPRLPNVRCPAISPHNQITTVRLHRTSISSAHTAVSSVLLFMRIQLPAVDSPTPPLLTLRTLPPTSPSPPCNGIRNEQSLRSGYPEAGPRLNGPCALFMGARATDASKGFTKFWNSPKVTSSSSS